MPIANLKRDWEIVGEVKVKALEKFFSLPFPKEYLEFLVNQNGGYLSPSHTYQMKYSGKTMNGGIRVLYGIGAPNAADINFKLDTFHSRERRMPDFLFPIGSDEGGNQICIILDKDRYGEVVFWDREDEIEFDADENRWEDDPLSNCHPIAKSFPEFLEILKPREI